MSNIKTALHHYRFDCSKPAEKSAYTELRENVLKKIGFPVWTMDLQYGYTANPAGWDFIKKIRGAAGPVELETNHVFNNQWNSAPIPGISENGFRLFNWSECVYPNVDIKEGYYLDQLPEMVEVLRNTAACGYCGKQEPMQKGNVFCPHCLGSQYLKVDQLHLTRMQAVDCKKDRAELSEAERAHLIPLYNEAQLHGQGERGIARMVKARADVEAEYKKAIRKAEIKYKGFTWLLDHGMNVDNVIYYDHVDRFSFGWRNPIDDILVSELLEIISEFPFKYEIKCADGRKLSN